MAAQQTYDLFNYLFRVTAYPIIQQHLLGRHLLANGEWSSSGNCTLVELDDYCLAYIYQFLPFRDLVRIRRTCRRLHHSVSEYLDTRKHFTYTCDLNGVYLENGHNPFNWAAFDFALLQMPNLRSLRFERCSMMRHTLATCSQNILERLTLRLYDLKMLHLSRSLAISPSTMATLRDAFPDLTHLTITLFNEAILAIIVDGFHSLKYLNLDESILYNYATILKRLPLSIRTFIAPIDLRNEKLAIVDALSQGNGRQLERLEMKICIHNLATEAEFFNRIGSKLKYLKWFQCEIACSIRETTLNRNHLEEEDCSEGEKRGTRRLELNQGSMVPTCTFDYEHRHVNLIRGLNSLKELRVLILKEKDYFDVEDRCTILDDRSMLDIFQSCPLLEMLSISCATRHNKPNYLQCEFESKENVQQVNRLLIKIIRERNANQSKSSEGKKGKNSKSRAVRIGKRPAFDRSESLLGELFEGQSDSDEHNLDSGINCDINCPHTISDGCLADIDEHLPKLRILQLRGIRLGFKSMEAIVNLKRLEHLRLDSISFNINEPNVKEHFTEFISKMTTANLKSKTNIRITNIAIL